MEKWVYSFGFNHIDAQCTDPFILGVKGANLAAMSQCGIPVPPGFTLSTRVCKYYYTYGQTFPKELMIQVQQALSHLESATQSRLGDAEAPLLVSVRSGAPLSMPGMMDTVLSLGLNDTTVETLAKKTGNRWFAYDSYRRFLQMYGVVVLGLEKYYFDEILSILKAKKNIDADTDLSDQDLVILTEHYKHLILQKTGFPCPQDTLQQLWGAIDAVIQSWNNPRAQTYRQLHNIPEDLGTAVTIQAMVFGNMGMDSATGVVFTRNPSTGDNQPVGEFLLNAQGEDVVAGIRTPSNLYKTSDGTSLEELMPTVVHDLHQCLELLEHHFKDMQDVEFTIQNKKLWILQTRSAKRSAAAAVQIAVDMVSEGILSEEDALLKIDPNVLEHILHPQVDLSSGDLPLTRGLAAAPGAATGRLSFSSAHAQEAAASGEKVILIRTETTPDDIHGLFVSQGIITTRGGVTSHAAVVARGMGRPCITGIQALLINEKECIAHVGETILRQGDWVTINGTSGDVFQGCIPLTSTEISDAFSKVMLWADHYRRLDIRTNAETVLDAEIARQFGADGIGLCRTEHMFFNSDRILSVRAMILAKSDKERHQALQNLLTFQKEDFLKLFRVMEGRPVNIRLLDPPLHEFLPTSEQEFLDLSNIIGVPPGLIRQRAQDLRQVNPMLGHRGCRLGITHPEIYQMQYRAIFEAMAESLTADHEPVSLEVMIPFVMMREEVDLLKTMGQNIAEKVMQKHKVTFPFSIGTMIELPRAALQAGQIAKAADFFSFGTNDLTQATLGLSRDDAVEMIQIYRRQGLMPQNPFGTLDMQGTHELIKLACERGRKTNPNLKISVCGEHAGDLESIKFFEEMELSYVSCSPYRIPVAKLAAAQAAILKKRRKDSSGSPLSLREKIFD